MKKIFVLFALAISATVASQNTAPVVSEIPDQSVGPCETFVTISLDDYVSDDSTLDADIIWSYSGNYELLVDISSRIATITLQTSNWYGSETITFTATDDDATDPLSDFDEASFTVTQMGIPTVGTITQPACGETTGSVPLGGLPASGSWTLTRTPGGTTTGTGTSTTISGLTPGTYTWTVTNADGCISGSSTPAVINTPPITPTTPTVGTITQPACGETTGSVPLGELPASGSWTLTRTPGGTTTGTGTSTTISGLTPGTYTWTVTNADGCISGSSTPAVINTPPVTPTPPTVGTIIQPACGETTGSVPLSGLPESGSWTLTRTPGGITTTGTGTSTTISGLIPGSYTWTVTNAAGCISGSSTPAVINTPPVIPTAPTVGTIIQPACGETTGSVPLSGLPESGSWTLTRTPGGTTTGSGTTFTVTGLSIGSYTWTVTNSGGCISGSSTPAVINTPPVTPTAPTVGTIIHPACGETTGSVPLGGLPSTGTWTLTRNPGGTTTTGTGTSTTISGLTPGSYTWTVTNAAGCISGSSTPAVINTPPVTPTAPTVGTIIQPACGETTGSVPLGGLPSTGTWTLTRNPGGTTTTGTGTSTTISGLAAGSYTWTVTNAAGCISGSSTPAVINTPPVIPTAPTVGTIIQPACGETTGSVPLSGLPASGAWTLTRTPGGTTTTGTGTSTTISGLTPGTYTWTVTNAGGCISGSSTPAVINTPPVTPTAPTVGTIIQPACGETTGSVPLSGLPASGAWILTRSPGGNTFGSGTTFNVTGLAAGSYTWTVTNSDGCTSVVSAEAVINTPPVTPTAPMVGTITQPACGETTGSVPLSGLPSTGTWTLTRNPGGTTTTGTGTSTTISGLTPGSYTWTVTNAGGCISGSSTPAVINTPPVTPTAPMVGTITQPACGETTGSVPLSGLPASGTWTLTRTPGGTTTTGTGTSTTISGLTPGSYTWTVTNATGCISGSSTPAVINTPPVTPTAPTVGTIIQPACGETTGSVPLSGLPASGTWTLTRTPGGTTTGSGTTFTVTGLAAGSYTWTVTNAGGCISGSSTPAVINTPPVIPTAPTVGTIIQPACGETTGSVPLSGLPASGAWTLTRTPGGTTTTGTGTSTTISGLTPGTYTWTVTNAGGCISGSSTPAVINTPPVTPTAPTVGTIIQPACGETTGSVPLSGLPASGAWILTRSPGGNTFGSGTTFNVTGLAAGSYTWTVTNSDGCTSVVSAEAVINTPPVTPTAPTVGTITQPACSETTGSVPLSGLPASGTWTLTRTPGGTTTTGTGTSTTISGLTPGSYTWTVTNAAGCISGSSTPAVINTPPVTPTAPTVGTIIQPACGETTGSVPLSGLPASGAWILTRSPGGNTFGSGTTFNVTGLAAGSYTWTVTNSDGCTSVVSAEAVINTPPVTPTAPTVGTIIHPACGETTGSVPLGGLPSTGTWTLTRNPGGTTTTGTGTSTTISGLTPGSYTWTVTNAAGCISGSSTPAVINTPPVTPTAPTVGTIIQPACGETTGSVPLGGLPSTGTWTLTRNPGGTTTTGTGTSTTISGLTPGSYTWTVTNAAGCISGSSTPAVINTPPVIPTAPTVGTITQPACGETTGSVPLSGLPASGAWILTRSPGGNTFGSGTTFNVTGLAAGSYTWTVTNSDGCTSAISAEAVINTPPVTPTAPIVGAITQPTCSLATGSVNLSGLPSTGTWTLTRNPGGTTTTGTGTSRIISGLPSGNYTYTVTNTDGCTSVASGPVVINAQPLTPTAPTVGTITQPTCSLATGSVTLGGLPSSGTWTLTRSPGGTTTTGTGTSRTISGLATGNYTWTVTNADGCTSDASGQVVINTQPLTPSAPVVGLITQPTCSLATGSVSLSGLPSSGTWTLTRNPGGTTITGTGTSRIISGLPSGNYTYTVTNADGCTSGASGPVVINTQPVTPSAPVVGLITQPTCILATGSVTLGGLPAVGTWTLTRNPGGTTTTGTGTSITISGLATGNYTWTVTNADGCTSDASGQVVINTQPLTPSAPVVGLITQPTCSVATGSVTLNGLPSSGTWTLTRNPGGTTTTGTGTNRTINGLASGNYTWTVTNEDGCTSGASGAVVINVQPVTPNAPSVGLINQPNCSVATGSVVLVGLPAIGTWTLIRSPGGATTTGNGTGTTISGLVPGNYTYTVTNADGCTSGASGPVVINTQPVTPSAPEVGLITQPTCSVATGNVTLSGLPAVGSWTLTRSPGGTTTTGTGTSRTINGLPSGNYTWTVTNEDGCTSDASGPVVINTQPVTPSAPAVGTITQPTCGVATGSVPLGGLPATGSWTLTRSPGGTTTTGTGTSTTLTGLTTGTYTWTVTNTDGCTSNASVPVVINTQPVTPTAPQTGTITQPTCSIVTGSVVLSGLPATGSWILTRSPGGTTFGSGLNFTVTGLAPGTYTWTVTNADGCTSNVSVQVVINAAPVTPTAPTLGPITQPTCSVATGSVTLNGLPSSGTWTLTRNPGGTTTTGTGTSINITILAPGTYTWTVTNTDGCTSNASVPAVINTQPVTPPAPVVGAITHPSCEVSTGSVVLGGLPPAGTWTLTRNPGGTTTTGSGTGTTVSGVPSGTYSWTVTSTDGCTSNASGPVLINAQPVTPPAPIVGTITQPTCSEATGSVYLSGLPSTGTWVLTRNPGGITTTGSGTHLTVSGLNPDAYSFRVTNSAGCTSPSSQPVVINLQPLTPEVPVVGTITQPTCYQATGSVVLSGLPVPGTWTLVRSPGGTTTTGTSAGTTITGLAPGNYTFIVRNAQGCPSPPSGEVRVISQPIQPDNPILLGESYAACQGDSILLDAGTGFDSYEWNNGATSRSIHVAATGTYSVTVTQGDCSAGADAAVTLNAIPGINLGSNITGCAGEPVPLDAGAGFDTYRWSTGANSRTIHVTQNGTYGVTVESNGCSNSDSVKVTFSSLPVIPLAISYYATSCITLDAGNTGSDYNWNTGATSQTIEACTTGTYSVVVTNASNCSASGETSVTIGEKPVVNLPTSLSGCKGESITLDAGSGFASYLWSTGATTQSISISSSGIYSVTVADSHNEQASDDVSVTFHNLPVVNLGRDQSICQDEPLELSAGSGFISYLWSTGESTQSITVTTAGNYSVTVNDGNCSASDQVGIQVKSLPAVNLGPDRSACTGDIVTLNAGGNYYAYYWNTGEKTASISVTEPGSYSVNVTDNGCSVIDNIKVSFSQLPQVELGTPISSCEGEQVTLNAGAGFIAYLWSTGETTQSISVTTSDNYRIIVSNENCNAYDAVKVTFRDSPHPELGPTVTSCVGEYPILDAGPGYAGYLWNTGGTSRIIAVTIPGTYSVSVSDGTCSGSDDVEVVFLEPPVVELGLPFTACEGEVTLDAGPGFELYIWSTGATTQTIPVDASAEYLVSVSNMCGSDSDGIIVTLIDQPDVDLGSDIIIPADTSILLSAGAGQLSYLWSTGATGNQILLSGLADGVYSYWVEVTGHNHCQNSDTIVVTVGEGTGMGESFLNAGINLYPNPTGDRFFVRSDDNIHSDITVSIYDATGKILLLEKWEDLTLNQPREIDISDFKPGIYVVHFYSDKKVATRKLIKH